jgi:predicted RNase H-like HicB family nuclease
MDINAKRFAMMNLAFETEQVADGRWIAEVPEIPGAMAYGGTKAEAIAKAEALALRALAERIEHGEAGPTPLSER